MNKISTVDARDQFSEIINRAAYGKERIVLTRRGKAVVALISLEDLELLEKLEDAIDIIEIEKALKEQGNKPYHSWKAIKAKLLKD